MAEVQQGWRVRTVNGSGEPGTYYVRNTNIGPQFGGTRGEAAVFPTAMAARMATLGAHSTAFVLCSLESPEGREVEL
jgi:hypothetical protein